MYAFVIATSFAIRSLTVTCAWVMEAKILTSLSQLSDNCLMADEIEVSHMGESKMILVVPSTDFSLTFVKKSKRNPKF